MKQTITNKMKSFMLLIAVMFLSSAAFAAKVDLPKFSPVAGTYTSVQTVSISVLVTTATIRYTLDGSSPSTTKGTIYTGPITISTSTRIKAIAYASGYSTSDVATGQYTINLTYAAVPVFSPTGGTFSSEQTVTITTPTSGASINYTTDGTTPSETNGTLYSSPVTVSVNTTLKAIAFKSGFNPSVVGTATYNIQAVAPTFSIAAGTYPSAQSVTLSSTTSEASFRYTTDGTNPTASNGNDYTGPITISANTTLKAITTKTGMTNSAVSTVVYSIQAAAPVFTPGEGTYAYARTIAITSATTFASIRYTTDGSTPTSTSGTVYSSEITVSATTTIKAIAYKSGYANSDVSSATFTIQDAAVEDPAFSPDGGIYASEQSVAINTATTGASIRYTTDGTTPTASVGTIYSSAITISANTTLKAIAYKSGFTNSNVNTAVYGIRVATPAFSPIPGTFTTAQNITLTTATSGATIYFTTDGTTPTVSSTLYSAPIFLNSTATIKALAVKAGMTNSIILSGTFNIQLLTVAAPTFTPAAGTYNSDQSVTIASATEGASIRYTTNGTLPTASVGTLYTAAIALSASSDFKAIAFKDGLLDSEVALSSYVLKCVTPSFNPPAGNIDRPQVITISATTAGSTVRYSTDGSEPTESTGIIYSAPVQVNTGQTLKAIAYKTGYTKSETGIAAYTLTSPDTDGDGVVDPEDEYPNDSQRALNTFYPAAGNGTVAFEDLWPAKGDYDMNDVVVDYSFRTVTNGSNQLVETFATFVLRASGAALHNGFGFEFANNIIPASAITVTGSRLTKSYITLGENGLEANQAKPVVVVFDNVFDLFANPGSGSGFNTTPGANFVDPVTINIHIVYTANTYSAEGLDLEHFNPFIIVNMERGKEVHLADHAPTSLADMSLFGTLEDNSVPAEGRYYRTSTNAPWALNIPESFDYPIEKTVILKAYPHFADWVQSGGTLFTDWYKNLSGYRHTEFIYQKN